MVNISHWFWPHYVYLGMTVIGIGLILGSDSETNDKVSGLIGTAITLVLLIVGGFFK